MHENLLETVLRDFQGTPVITAHVALVELDPADLAEAEREIPDAAEWIDPTEPSRRRLLLRVEGRVTAVAADDTAGRRAEIASALQDFVIDEQGRPWPEVRTPDGVKVLAPGIDTRGRSVWSTGGGPVCEIGDLGRHLRR